MRINDEPFERGQTIEHKEGFLHIYEGRATAISMIGPSSFHVLRLRVSDVQSLATDVFMKNYLEPGTWRKPEVGGVWHHKRAIKSFIKIHKVVDDMVIYWYVNQVEGDPHVFYARAYDEFCKQFRYGHR